MMSLESNLKEIKEKIAHEKSTHNLSLNPIIVAVSKKQPLEKIETLVDLGVQHFGENYLQEALPKIDKLKTLPIQWHYLGQIQSKKIKDLVGNFELIQTVSRLSELEKISKVAAVKKIQQNFLVQVNIAQEKTKQGFHPDELPEVSKVCKALPHVQLQGLMVFPPLVADGAEETPWCRRSYELFKSFERQWGSPLPTLSMGTSSDYPAAVREGATMVRLGECLLGPRP